MSLPRITFGMIVLNGEPFLRYNLRALYPFAHQIIVVEGASPYAANIATSDGHSIDGTLELLKRLMHEEDPENKIILVTAEDEGYQDGFWRGEKDEQSQAYAKRATGDWLWQVDVDEFYQPDDMEWICKNLLEHPQTQSVSFKQIQFWGDLGYYVDGWYLRHKQGEVFHRLFRWKPSFVYATHRPPTVLDENGNDLRSAGWITPYELKKKRIFLYHYSLVFPVQVKGKSNYYKNVKWGNFNKMNAWVRENFQVLGHPFRIHNVYQYPSWLEEFSGKHPPQVQMMWDDISNHRLEQDVLLRPTDDLIKTVHSPVYRLARTFLKAAGILIFSTKRLVLQGFHLLPKRMQSFAKGLRTKIDVQNA